MLYPENNPELVNTNEEAVVNQIEMEENSTSIEPKAITTSEINDEVIEEKVEIKNENSDFEPKMSETETVQAENSSILTTEIGVVDDEEDDEESKMIDEEESLNIDYSANTKEQLLEMALEAPSKMVAREAVKKIQNIRPFFDLIIKHERNEQLQKHVEAGNDESTFEYVEDGSKQKFYEAYKLAQEARFNEKKRIENEKLKNLELKNSIIERIKQLTESDETVDSLNQIKLLQNEWKSIRVLPKANLQELYDRYHFYLDKFYDNFAINRELKDLDRQKNLGIKIDLCNKVDALQNESSLKRAFILLAKYQEEFKNTGPVPKEFSEEIWTRFKSTLDTIYEQRKTQFDEIQGKREDNLKLKEVLVEKARLIANHIPTKGSEWKSNFEELNKLMEEWKTIGQVPKAHNESIWQQFKDQFNVFSKNRNEHFKKSNAERKANIAIKEELCKKAEELKDSEDLIGTSKELIKLQEEWKASGIVPESVSQVLWKRFRKACDEFFNRKNESYASQKGEENENLLKKEVLITQLEALKDSDNADEVLAKLKEVQVQWNEIGFVPIKLKKDLGDKYHGLLDIIYKKFRQNKDAYRRAHNNQHYNQIANQPGGDKKLGDDERRIREKIKGLKTEIETWENNIEFFARSKNADKFRKDIEDKIAKVNGQIESLNKELKSLQAAKAEKV